MRGRSAAGLYAGMVVAAATDTVLIRAGLEKACAVEFLLCRLVERIHFPEWEVDSCRLL